jgi:hypothetical protein
VGDEWARWYRLTPLQRWLQSEKLWQTYLALGGSLDPEPEEPNGDRPRVATLFACGFAVLTKNENLFDAALHILEDP